LTRVDHHPPDVTKDLAGHCYLDATMKYYNQVDNYHRQNAAEIMQKWLDKKIG
jgi:hypothetical protein